MKSYLDYGAFTPVQAAATAALNGPQDIVDSTAPSTRSAATCWSTASAAPAGTSPCRKPACSPGRRSPSSSSDIGALEFSKRLLSEAHVAVAPGVGFGELGEGYVRLALVENEQRLRQAARGVKKMLAAG